MNNITDKEKMRHVTCTMSAYITIMQTLGFALKSLQEDNDNNIQGSENNKEIRVQISCPQCKLTACLVQTGTECVGPSPSQSDVTEARFWTVTGTGPQQDVVVNKSFSSLLPEFPKDKQRQLSDLLDRSVRLIREDPDRIANTSAARLSRSVGSLSLSESSSTRMTKTPDFSSAKWEMDPKAYPPLDNSSPIPHINPQPKETTFAISELLLMSEYLNKVKCLVDSKLADGKSNTFVKNLKQEPVQKKRISDIKPPTPIPTPVAPKKSTPVVKRVLPTMASATKKKVTPVGTIKKSIARPGFTRTPSTPTTSATAFGSTTPRTVASNLKSKRNEKPPSKLARPTAKRINKM